MASRPNKSEFIQLLRFVASALVVITHATFYYSERVDQRFPVWEFGAIGVPIFFAISGLVMITSSVSIPLNRFGAASFFRKRVIRILPLYWAVTLVKVIVTLIVPSVVNHNHFNWLYALKSFFFIPAFNAEGEVRPIHGVGWTLLHEMFFYVCFSFSMMCKVRPIWSVSFFIVSTFVMGKFWTINSPLYLVVTNGVNLYFVIGMLAGRMLTGDSNKYALMSFSIFVFIVQSLVSYSGWQTLSTSALPINGWVVATILMTVSLNGLSIPPRFHICVKLGDSSYALYLLHPIICPALVIVSSRLLGSHRAAGTILISVVITVLLSHFSHILIEQRMTKFARILWPEKRQRNSTGPSTLEKHTEIGKVG